VWGAWAAGLVGWLLVLSGLGKLTLWQEFREALQRSAVLPPAVAAPAGLVAPFVELAVGAAVLVRPVAADLGAAAVLYALFAAYQGALWRRGGQEGCRCYGRLRQVREGGPAAVGNAALAALALAAAWRPGAALGWRLAGGFALAVVYLWAMGRQASPRPRFVFAEVRYLEERAAGKSDREARAAVAAEFGVSVEASYLLIPRVRAHVLLWRRRLGLKTTL
jgi:hypothetical protein